MNNMERICFGLLGLKQIAIGLSSVYRLIKSNSSLHPAQCLAFGTLINVGLRNLRHAIISHTVSENELMNNEPPLNSPVTVLTFQKTAEEFPKDEDILNQLSQIPSLYNEQTVEARKVPNLKFHSAEGRDNCHIPPIMVVDDSVTAQFKNVTDTDSEACSNIESITRGNRNVVQIRSDSNTISNLPGGQVLPHKLHILDRAMLNAANSNSEKSAICDDTRTPFNSYSEWPNSPAHIQILQCDRLICPTPEEVKGHPNFEKLVIHPDNLNVCDNALLSETFQSSLGDSCDFEFIDLDKIDVNKVTEEFEILGKTLLHEQGIQSIDDIESHGNTESEDPKSNINTGSEKAEICSRERADKLDQKNYTRPEQLDGHINEKAKKPEIYDNVNAKKLKSHDESVSEAAESYNIARSAESLKTCHRSKQIACLIRDRLEKPENHVFIRAEKIKNSSYDEAESVINVIPEEPESKVNEKSNVLESNINDKSDEHKSYINHLEPESQNDALYEPERHMKDTLNKRKRHNDKSNESESHINETSNEPETHNNDALNELKRHMNDVSDERESYTDTPDEPESHINETSNKPENHNHDVLYETERPNNDVSNEPESPTDTSDEQESYIDIYDEPKSHNDTSDEPESHNDTCNEPESQTDISDGPESHSNTFDEPESHTDTFDEPESHGKNTSDEKEIHRKNINNKLESHRNETSDEPEGYNYIEPKETNYSKSNEPTLYDSFGDQGQCSSEFLYHSTSDHEHMESL